ncbi:MAG: hypothetical protein GKR88_15380 [Flavobacteriaceae bacterium]|nr:MAG: hypothetical protein GKR88_15380 [Flavobacteriaceae bacterium]
MEFSQPQNGTNTMLVPFFNQLYQKNPKLFGNFFRSTLDLASKFALLNDCLQSKSAENLAKLNEVLTRNYETDKISERNAQWLAYFTQNDNEKQMNTNFKITYYDKSI